MTRSGKKGKVLFGLLFAAGALLLGALLSLHRCDFQYKIKGEPIALTDYAYAVSDAEYEPESGSYRVTGEDPYLSFTGIDRSLPGVLVTLSEPVERDLPLSVYWTRGAGEPYVGALYDTTVIKKGKTQGYVRLPDYPVSAVRLDLDGDCTIRFLWSGAGIQVTRTFPRAFYLSAICKGILIFLICFWPFCAFRREREMGGAVTGRTTGKPYYAYLDVLRITATVFVIALHLLNDTFMPTVTRGDAGYGFFKFVEALTICCNAIYVLLSGALILRPSEEKIGEFYRRKLPQLLVPMLCYFCWYMLQGFSEEIFRDGLFAGLRSILSYLLAGRSPYTAHFWLVYVIFGLYLVAPFFRILIAHLTSRQLLLLIALCFGIEVLTTYLPFAHFYFGVESTVTAWGGLFLLGYYLTTEDARRFDLCFLLLGLLGFLLSFLTHYFHPELLETAATNAPSMWLMAAGLFTVVRRITERLGVKKHPAVLSLARHSYGMLLIHLYFLSKLVLPIGWRYETEHGRLKLSMLLMAIITFVISYLFAVVYDHTAVWCANRMFSSKARRSDSGQRYC